MVRVALGGERKRAVEDDALAVLPRQPVERRTRGRGGVDPLGRGADERRLVAAAVVPCDRHGVGHVAAEAVAGGDVGAGVLGVAEGLATHAARQTGAQKS